MARRTDEKVREHLKRFTKSEHMAKRHEAKEAPRFERKEQKLMHEGARLKRG